MVLRGGERHQLFLFFYPIVGAAMLLLLKWSVIQLVKLLPKVFVELLKREIPAFLQIMEEPLFENAYRVFHRRFVLLIGNFR